MPISAFMGESQFASASTLVSSRGGVPVDAPSTQPVSGDSFKDSEQPVIEPFKAIKSCKTAKSNHYREQLCQIFGQKWQHWLIGLICCQEGVEGPARKNCIHVDL